MLAPPTTVSRPCKYGHTKGRALNRECRECKRLRQEKLRAEHPEEILNTRLRYRYNNLEKIMFRSARNNAKLKNLACTITAADIIIPEFCPLLGLRLDRNRIGPRENNSPSLDRFDSTLGYVPGNIWVISWRANQLKSNATLAELQLLVSSLSNFVRTYPWGT